MYKKYAFVILCLLSSGCIIESCENPLAPSSSRGSSSSRKTEVWIHPNVGSVDAPDMFTNPELWPEARNLITTYQFHHVHLLRGNYSMRDGNTVDKFIEVDAFRFLGRAGKKISFEAGALKHHGGNCAATIPGSISSSMEAINNVQSNGGIVSSISIDWTFGASPDGCNFTDDETAVLTAQYFRAIKGANPHIQIGLTEGYPSWNLEKFESILDSMIRAGAKPDFIHIDYDRDATQRPGPDVANSGGYNPTEDIPRIRDLVRSRGVKFGVIVFGDGTSTESFAGDAILASRQILNATGGDLDRIIFESWSDYPPTRNGKSYSDDRLFPLNLPETKSGTLTWQVLNEGGRYR